MQRLRSIRFALVAPVAAILLASSAASGQVSPDPLEILPPNPGPSDEVTVVLRTILEGCNEPCVSTSTAVAGGSIQIDWFLRDTAAPPDFICPDVIWEYSEEVVLGVLPSGDYEVTMQEIWAQFGTTCPEGSPTTSASISFTVGGPPIPTASAWGLAVLALLLLVAGALRVRRTGIRSNSTRRA